jgi:hypothetical protein
MQVRESKSVPMKCDMDLIRDLLLHVESDPLFDGRRWVSPDTPADFDPSGNHSMEEINYHLDLLIEAGFLKGKPGASFHAPLINRLTWDGHEFLNDIRDQDIWSKTKKRLEGLQSVALGIVAEVAKAEIKKRLGLS